ncbi:putative MutT/NudX family protein [Streptococcus gordonii]|uniref:Putative MutT/NudX family protein n=1 Tax=Streptococcus gordonii TaxID=1302 RepID=A0A139NCI4_STRGN|nr:putative MutT/NudX family protein [Streptococcus gordonii]
MLINLSKIKLSLANVYTSCLDTIGGSVEENELPREAALCEAVEEVNQKIRIDRMNDES